MTQTPTQSPLDAKGLDAAVAAFRATNYQGYLYGNRHVIRDMNAKGSPEVWSITTDEYDAGHAAMEIQCERLEIQDVVRAYISSQEAAAPSEVDYALRHYDPVRVALEKQEALAFEEDREEDHLYWRHEIKALDDARNAVRASPAVAPVAVSVKWGGIADRLNELADSSHSDHDKIRLMLKVAEAHDKRSSIIPATKELDDNDFHIYAGAELRRLNRIIEPRQDQPIATSCEAAALDLVVAALRSSGFIISRVVIPATKGGEDAGALLQELAHDPRILIMGSDPRAALAAALSQGTDTEVKP